jgi:ABC-2 type transport system ATP-binding protein
MDTLQATNLRKAFGSGAKRVEAVRAVSLSIAPGTILAFLGPNGAGKSTTIKMIAGLLTPDEGQVLINGKDPIKSRSVYARVGIVLEGSRNVYQQLSARENLEYFGVIKGLSGGEAKARAVELLSFFKLNHKTNTRVSELSSGMQQKLTIAVALMNRPQLLLLDEPTNALDVESAEDIKTLMRQMAADGLAILLTTHQLDMAQQTAHRTAIIRGGKMLIESDTESLLKRFSGDFYKLTFEGSLTEEQLGKLAQIGATVDGASLRFHGDANLVYSVLEAVKPNPITQLTKGDNDLSSVFLKLIKEDGKC